MAGMVRLWTLEAMAHGAELVSYFRWRQAPFGQEQLHAGLLRPDDESAPVLGEVETVAREIGDLGPLGSGPRQVALIFSYEADWVTSIQPQGAGLSALWAAFDFYSGLRQMGLNVDIVHPSASLDGYELCVIPCLPIVSDVLLRNLEKFCGQVVVGPRSGSRGTDFAIPDGLPPGALFPGKVSRIESLRPGLAHEGDGWRIEQWLEHLETDAEPELVAADGTTASWRAGSIRYLGAWPTPDIVRALLGLAVLDTNLSTHNLPEGLRLRQAGDHIFAFNYGNESCDVPPSIPECVVLGDRKIIPAGVAVYKNVLN
ncbi:beta-galactosidase [Sphingopyxis sp. MC1]|nr:beta-galactosidase [Sphingopyxis sp. MC1]